MSGINSVLQTALRSMELATQSLAVASNNIANEKTPGYAKQRLVVESTPPSDGYLRIGTGAQAVEVEGLRDELLERRVREEGSSKAGEESLNKMLADIEAVFNDAAGTGMLPAITEFFNAFHSLALDPASTNLREEVRTAAQGLINSFDTRAVELQRIQSVADQNVIASARSVNDLATEIASLSSRIRSEEAAGGVSNELRDKRGELVRQLAEIVNVQELGTGSEYQLSIGGALIVFDGRTIPVIADTSGPSGFATLKVDSIDVSASITSGKVAAWMAVRDSKVPDYLGALDQLAYEISQQVNAIHTTAYNPSGATGIDFFAPMAAPADAARQLSLSSDVLADVNNIAASGASAGTDNQAATAIGNLLHTPSFSGGSVVDQYRSLVFQIASDVTDSGNRLDQHATLYHQLQNRRDSLSGVSVDEETMRILQFQRSYQASANVIRIVDELIQTLLGMGR